MNKKNLRELEKKQRAEAARKREPRLTSIQGIFIPLVWISLFVFLKNDYTIELLLTFYFGFLSFGIFVLIAMYALFDTKILGKSMYYYSQNILNKYKVYTWFLVNLIIIIFLFFNKENIAILFIFASIYNLGSLLLKIFFLNIEVKNLKDNPDNILYYLLATTGIDEKLILDILKGSNSNVQEDLYEYIIFFENIDVKYYEDKEFIKKVLDIDVGSREIKNLLLNKYIDNILISKEKIKKVDLGKNYSEYRKLIKNLTLENVEHMMHCMQSNSNNSSIEFSFDIDRKKYIDFCEEIYINGKNINESKYNQKFNKEYANKKIIIDYKNQLILDNLYKRLYELTINENFISNLFIFLEASSNKNRIFEKYYFSLLKLGILKEDLNILEKLKLNINEICPDKNSINQLKTIVGLLTIIKKNLILNNKNGNIKHTLEELYEILKQKLEEQKEISKEIDSNDMIDLKWIIKLNQVDFLKLEPFS